MCLLMLVCRWSNTNQKAQQRVTPSGCPDYYRWLIRIVLRNWNHACAMGSVFSYVCCLSGGSDRVSLYLALIEIISPHRTHPALPYPVEHFHW